MTLIARTVSINALPDKVWKIITDVERWPEWATYMKRLEPQGEATLGLGSLVKVTPKGLPGSIWEVTEFDSARSYTWVTSLAPGLRMTGGHVVEPEGAGARVTFSLEVSGPVGALVGPLLAVVFRRNTRLATEGLKAYCEQST